MLRVVCLSAAMLGSRPAIKRTVGQVIKIIIIFFNPIREGYSHAFNLSKLESHCNI